MLSFARPDVNLADLSRLMAETNDERARQQAIIRARHYHSGQHHVKLTDRLRLFLRDMAGGQDYEYLRLNITHTIVTAVVERLVVEQWMSADDALADFAQQVWTHSGGATMADDAHTWAVRDGEAFILVDWDVDANLPILVVHPRYVDAALDDPLGTSFGNDTSLPMSGQGYGCVATYPDDDMSRPPLRVVKRWTEIDSVTGKRRQRMTAYYPDRVEKFTLTPQRQPVTDYPGEPWPLPLVYNGAPLGIPVVPLYNPGAACEAWEAIPIQNAINKTLIDLIAAGDMTAFRILFASGWLPTTNGQPPDGTNGLPVNPGQWVGSMNPDAKLQSVEGADLGRIADTIERLIQWAAMVTDTPVARFTLTRQIASADTLKAQEGPLVRKVEKRQALFGTQWAQVMRIAARLTALYAPAQISPADPDSDLLVQWTPAATPDPLADLEVLRLKREALGIPRQQLWREAGYTEDQITQMLADSAVDDARRAALFPQPTTPTPGGQPAEEDRV